ncbi:MAG: YaeQ family protein [Saccharospirillaceae bacterium]|nr:YaeQ family protein [Pseudomonadales bacterium]NRB78934.1 YaeQ family protein [Saccharospirillaceae bacterium]
MAISATVIRAKISIADMTRHYYQDHSLTLAQHPSENANRLMIRLLAYAVNAHEDLQFTKGLSTSDEPEIWLKDLTDIIELWIDLGLPDESRIKKSINRSQKSILYCYDDKSFAPWFKKNESKLTHKKLSVFKISDKNATQLESLYARALDLQINIDESDIMIVDNNTNKTIEIQIEKVL